MIIIVWERPASTEPSQRWMVSASETMRVHLRDCVHQPLDVREQALEDHKAHSSKRRGDPPVHEAVPLQYALPSGFAPMLGGLGPSNLSPLAINPLPMMQASPSPASAAGSSSMTTQFPHLLQLNSAQGSPTGSPSGSQPVSRSGTPNPWKRQRTGYTTALSRQPSLSGLSTALAWDSSTQNRFNTRMARLTAALGLPLSWVENVEWIEFCNDFLPNAKVPSRKVLTLTLIPSTLKEYRAAAQAAC